MINIRRDTAVLLLLVLVCGFCCSALLLCCSALCPLSELRWAVPGYVLLLLYVHTKTQAETASIQKDEEAKNTTDQRDKRMNPRSFVIQRNLELQNCVYTVIPVMNHQLLNLPYHVRRLYDSSQLLNPPLSAALESCSSGTNSKRMSSIQLLLSRELSSLPQNFNDGGDGLLTLCWGHSRGPTSTYETSSNGVLDTFVYPQPPGAFSSAVGKGVVVDLQRYRRQTDPRIKAASWPSERVHLEGNRPKHATETLIYDDDDSDCKVTEGLTSNLFVVEDDCLVTAPEGAALSGSMAHIVLGVAKSMGIRVDRRCPTFPGMTPTTIPWTTAFLTSATKPMVPITAILDSAGNIMQNLHTKNDIYGALRCKFRCFH